MIINKTIFRFMLFIALPTLNHATAEEIMDQSPFNNFHEVTCSEKSILNNTSETSTPSSIQAGYENNSFIGFMDFYHLPHNHNMININHFTTRSIIDIHYGMKLGRHSYIPANRIFLDDGSSWEIEGSLPLVSVNNFINIGDQVIIRPLSWNDSGVYSFALENISSRHYTRANLLDIENVVATYRYQITAILLPEGDATNACLVLYDAHSDIESTWIVPNQDKLEDWAVGHDVTIGSQESSLDEIPKHVLINRTLSLKKREPIFLQADLVI